MHQQNRAVTKATLTCRKATAYAPLLLPWLSTFSAFGLVLRCEQENCDWYCERCLGSTDGSASTSCFLEDVGMAFQAWNVVGRASYHCNTTKDDVFVTDKGFPNLGHHSHWTVFLPNNPDPTSEYNKNVSRIRSVVENCFGSLERFRIISDLFRLHLKKGPTRKQKA
ncbi:hypothetical protein QOT17_002093 [Balamuthia mandrillaris]